MKLIKKFLELTIFIAVFCVIGTYGSLEIGVAEFKETIIYCTLLVAYISMASMAIICIGKRKCSQGVGTPRELELINISRKL
jgi:hypothetical protein